MRRHIPARTAALLATVLALTGQGPARPAPSPAGQLLSVGPLPAAATPPGSAGSVRIVYRTSGVAGAPALSSGAIYFPPGRPPVGGWPVLAWAHGTVGLADHCAYSIAGPVERERDWAYLGSWLRQGYAIVATDYTGLGTGGQLPYLNGRVEAHNVVDAVRAAAGRFPDRLARRWMVVGQSQGGGAAVITARYATALGGPALDYRGAVGTGVPAHVEDAVATLGPHVPPVALPPNTTSYLLYLLSGLRTSFPGLDIDSYLTGAGRRWVAIAERECGPDLVSELRSARPVFGDLLAKPLAALPDAHQLLFDYMGIPVSGYDRPLFIGQGLRDTDVLVPGTVATVAAMRANNQPVTFRTYPTNHDGTVNASLIDSVPFVRSLLRN